MTGPEQSGFDGLSLSALGSFGGPARRAGLSALVLLALAACDVTTPGREQRAGAVGTIEDANVVVAAEDPVGVGAPPAWRVVGAAAAYGADGAEPLLSLRCERAAGMLVLERGGGGQALTIAAGDLEQTLPVEAGEKDKVRARVPLDDPLLGRMAASQSRMFLVTANGERIPLPGGVAVRRVLDACRTPAPAVAPEPSAPADPANAAAPVTPPPVAVPAPPPAQP